MSIQKVKNLIKTPDITTIDSTFPDGTLPTKDQNTGRLTYYHPLEETKIVVAVSFDKETGRLSVVKEDKTEIVIEGLPTIKTLGVGPKGERGNKGKDGRDGFDGRKGPDGHPGCPGPPGPKGLTGRDGSDGRDGDQGYMGAAGCCGPKGPQGQIGPEGPKGTQGACGPKGCNGIVRGAAIPGASAPSLPDSIEISLTEPLDALLWGSIL